MGSPYRSDVIDNWVGDFCASDALNEFGGATREFASSILARFLTSACDARDVEPGEIEESDARAALIDTVARLQLPESARREAPDLCAAFVTQLEREGRLAGGRVLGAFVRALRDPFEQTATGKPKPLVNPGSKIGRNDPCPCGSGKKYKKCCMGE